MKRHALDVLSLAFGVFFLLVAAAFMSDVIDLSVLRFEWLGALALLALGAVLLLTARGTNRGNGS